MRYLWHRIESIPIAAAAHRATDLTQYQQDQADYEQDPADGGDDARDREQVADEDKDDTENDHWVVLPAGLAVGGAVPVSEADTRERP
jgi:hypothetical protein